MYVCATVFVSCYLITQFCKTLSSSSLLKKKHAIFTKKNSTVDKQG
jgi:hypothetical protein